MFIFVPNLFIQLLGLYQNPVYNYIILKIVGKVKSCTPRRTAKAKKPTGKTNKKT